MELWGGVGRKRRFSKLRQSKVRYNFDPDIQELVIHMATITHDRFAAAVVQNVLFQLKKMTNEPSAAVAAVARNIVWQGSAQILLREEPGSGTTHGTKSDLQVAHIIPYSVGKSQARTSTDLWTVLRMFWGEDEVNRLQSLIFGPPADPPGPNARTLINQLYNVICTGTHILGPWVYRSGAASR
ncbi:hypothetical protein GP486_003492 [Trichoglossum hirsutum]|uniref:HNH nuclease domain-containing protein n=1 Tax=Trichoglossum hirsutum TaxID=265104 RepID=A0A9P8LD07_9PEZI|nr:hypothetical protein GP486_003492 [Trichoglossum hirsutum]